MPARQNPLAARRQDIFVVQAQCFDCSPAYRCDAYDTDTVFAPAEMLGPKLRPGVEQRNQTSRMGINGLGLRGFVAVAPGAGEPQIRFIGCPTGCQRNDVFDLHLPAADLLGSLTVSTAISGGENDPLA